MNRISHSVIPALRRAQDKLTCGQAGIQMIKNFPRRWDNIVVLSASQGICFCWIPAYAGMTA
jgi:hypothetical protein